MAAREDDIATIARRALAEEALVDVFGLFALLWQVKHEMPALDADAAKRAVLAAIGEAISRRDLEPGELSSDGAAGERFVPWRLPIDEALARIEASCDRARESDLVWFARPDVARAHGAKNDAPRPSDGMTAGIS